MLVTGEVLLGDGLPNMTANRFCSGSMGERKTLSDLEDINVAELAERCAQETAKSRRKRPADDRYCFELFRRAIVQQDQQAWEAVFHQYRRLVYDWIGASHPRVEDLVNETFARFWQGVTPHTFQSRFHDLGGVLAYLKVCAKNLVINHERRRERERLAHSLVQGFALHPPDPERRAIETLAGQKLAAYIKSCLRDKSDQLVFHLSFELGLKPKEIYEQHPHEFESAKQVSRIKERILKRMRRDPMLLKLWGEG
jgi:RNA polymerase sigma factor (sigma-70 family)